MGGLEEVFVKEAFDTNWIAPLGANVDGFEKELSEYVGSKTGAALASGTAAIHMALKAVGVKKGDKVFCSSLTFAASCNPIIYEGGIPVFIDSEPESHNMSPVALEKAFKDYEEKGEMPKAVIVVNLYGQSADMDKIMEICKKYNVPIIEDAAESLGATYKGKHSGTFGEYGIYSFNGNKIITTSGGGMLVSNNEEGIAKVRFWSTQARDKARHYEHTELGYNYRMSNIVAGIGRGQLRVLEDRVAKKKEIFETYKEAFIEIEDIEMMPVCEYGEPNYWLTTITLNENSKVKPLDIILALEKENIESRPIWKPMHIQPYYKEYDFYSHNDEGEISVSEDIFNRGMCLPSDTKMSDHDMDRVIKIIKNLFQKEINEIDRKKEVLV
ncbi:DegT/DnrJ/EryC1/StrS family aminotransferase [Clostridium perfringens]|uniref:DegT/DnrJ/EryC1/StrS family aminotransferase n=1 Tax=Clostridium perfringens TaxID=1502 RepID=UPI002AC76127|nr:aminotransferase class I/II-fold pyridoxal phosphate-dependent enzyme [Clostridium perfringens]MDZ5063720.1 aminotransferase class I/II-fold pyridoxal phosphate-dependent enzyme [Clostridium perfringens]